MTPLQKDPKQLGAIEKRSGHKSGLQMWSKRLPNPGPRAHGPTGNQIRS